MKLKTKLVIAISAMVVALVGALSTIYVAQLAHQVIHDAYDSGNFVAREIIHGSRDAIEADSSNPRVRLDDPESVRLFIEEALATDAGLNSLMESVVGYSPVISDVAVVDLKGNALLHSDSDLIGKPVPSRPDFRQLDQAAFWRQLRAVNGPPRVYVVTVPIERGSVPFGSVQVGISTVFLKSTLQPQLRRAVLFSAISIVVSLILAAGLSSFALRPLALISRRLDQFNAGEIAPLPASQRSRQDEYGAVSSKIERIGEQMRSVNEVFAALQENVDQVMSTLQDGLMLFTRNHRVVLVSASIEHFLRRSRSEMLGNSVESLFSHADPLGAAVLDAFAFHRPITKEEVALPGGRRFELSLDFIEERGQQLGALLTLRDAESVQKIEGEIEVSRRLANIGKLTSGVAHEVKNPINAIVVHLEILRNKLVSTDPATQRHMEVIASEIQRLDRVVKTLVDFSRPVELQLAEIDLRRVVDDLAVLAAPDAAQHRVEIVTENAGQPILVKADVGLLKQAILNIVLNGVQAMPEGGKLAIRTRRLEGEGRIEIEDQGTGIPAELRDKIFNLYFTTKKEGSGIGLAMTYRVMQLHNGSVDFSSSAAGNGSQRTGTTFYLSIPLSRAEQRSEAGMATQS